MQIVMAGFDKVDPAIDVSTFSQSGNSGALDEEMAVVGEYALHRRIGAASRVCVLTT